MHLTTFRRADGDTPVRPPGRHPWATGALLVLSVVLLTWAGSSLLPVGPAEGGGARGQGSGQKEGQGAGRGEDRGYTFTQADRRLLRAARRATTLIEPPLAGSAGTLSSGGATVQPPQDVPEPTRITIPSLDIDQDLTELAVIGRTLQVPDDYADIGWWGGGPVPGRQGSAVLVGHVDSPTGPAVFYQLSGVARGSRVEVRLDDGARAVFAITDVEVYDRDSFPSSEVYQAQGRPGLHLVTCGGTFDTGTQQYSSNVVVSARLVERIPAGGNGPEDRPSRGAGPGASTGAGSGRTT